MEFANPFVYEYRFETNTCNLVGANVTVQYNFFARAKGRVHVLKEWKKAGIKGVLTGREVLLRIKCELCITQKREIKVIQNITLSQNCEI